MTAVFLAEDNAPLRDLLCEALQDEGHQVFILPDMESVAEFAHTLGHGLAIVDGCGNSFAALHAVDRSRISSLATNVPTILITGRAWADTIDGNDLGLAGLLKKPLELQHLLELVDSLQQSICQ
ncbi:MAG: hypothetical protein JO057_05780 [Chloroflexi bacterium]|nr:hypothetical protein [Chloroflexota bacterium]